MTGNIWRKFDGRRPNALRLAIISLTGIAGCVAASAQNGSAYFTPGNLVVSRSVYDNNPNNVVAGVTVLPPNCSAASGSCTTPPTTAINDGTYPYLWNNDTVDANYGHTSQLFLAQTTP